MFSKATANFVRQIDPNGSLIHVSRVNDSHKLVPMALVVKCNRFWAWQRPKYQSTDFTLSDLLMGDEVLRPGVTENDFLSYKGRYGDKVSGTLEAEAGPGSMALEGRGSTVLLSCFGKLTKEEMDVKKLLHDSSNRLVNMEHDLVRQLEKRSVVLAVVKERILTTSSCTIKETIKEKCSFTGVLKLVGILGSSVKVCVEESNNIEEGRDVSLEIPPGTVIAYSILELNIKKDGNYEVCLHPGKVGGFEADMVTSKSSHDGADTLDGSQEMHLSPLANLPQSVGHDLFLKLQETMRDSLALTCLQSCLEEELLSSGEPLHMEKQEEEEELLQSKKKMVSAIMDCSSTGSHTVRSARLRATHLLVSALEEMSNETLSLLSESSPNILEAFDTLLSRLKESSTPLPIQSLPVLLQDNQTFQLAEHLFGSTNVTLRRDTDRLWVEEELPLVLILSIRGLFLLCNGQK